MSTPHLSRTLLRAARAPLVHIRSSPARCSGISTQSQLCVAVRGISTCNSAARSSVADVGVRGMRGEMPGSLERSGRIGKIGCGGQRRSYSQENDGQSKQYSFEDILTLSSTPPSTRPHTHLIDVRTPNELQTTGRIPTALNIPTTTHPDAFSISAEEFEDRFGFERPGKEDECVFYCQAGVRSRATAEIARVHGWRKVGEFKGSWGEWSGRGGEVER